MELLPEAAAIGTGSKPDATMVDLRRGLPELIRRFKTFLSRRVKRGTSGAPLWQGNYYEHVTRSEHELDDIRQYIQG